jgi:NADH dehydrogenase FAD-containing subunit
MERKQVVILGAGYAGVTAAAKLDQANRVDVTLISPTEGYLLHKIAGLRAVTKGGNW